MKQQIEEWHPTGIQVTGERKLKIETRKKTIKYGLLLRCLYLYLCLLGTILTLRQELGLEFPLLLAAGSLLIAALLAVLKNIWLAWGKRIYNTGYLLLLMFSAINWKHLAAGCQVMENGVRHQLSSYYGVTLAEKTPMIADEQGVWIIILLFALLFWSMETMVIRKGRTGLLITSEILFILLELLCGCRFRQPGILLIAGSLFALAAMGQKTGLMNQRILYRSGVWAGGMILVLSLIAGLSGSALTEKTKGWNEWLYQNVQEKTSRFSRALQSQNGLFGNHNPTADGSLNNYPVEQKNETDLCVSSSVKPTHNMYLRGFTGGVYQGDYWSGPERKDFDEVFPEGDGGWQVQNILYRYIRSRSSEEEGTVTVTREHPGGDYGYVPYGFEIPDDENVQGDRGYASAEKEVTYKGYVNWTEWMDPQPSTEAESEIESVYQKFAADEYLKVPVKGLDRLRAYCDQQNLQSVQEVIDFVVRDVQEGRTYSMDLEPVPADKDFAEYFFFDQKKGYCIHYATTATLMFRMLGVPARYVTGYVITPEAFVADENGYTAQVPDTQAHAWVEVYRSGKGWIPVEVTPGYEENNIESGISTDTEDTAVPSPQQQEQITPEPDTESQTTPEVTTSPGNENMQETGNTEEGTAAGQNASDESLEGKKITVIHGILKIFWYLLIVGGIGGCGFGVLILRRKQMLQKKEYSFFQKNINEGICEISYGIYQMLMDAKEAGALPEIKECIRDREFACQIEKQVPWMEEGEYRKIIEIVERASFGPDQLTAENRRQCYQLYRQLEKWLWTRVPKKKRFWWKYMKGYENS